MFIINSLNSVGSIVGAIEDGFMSPSFASHPSDKVRLAVARNLTDSTEDVDFIFYNDMLNDPSHEVRAELAKIHGEHLEFLINDPVLEVSTQAHMTLGTPEFDDFVASISPDEPIDLDDLDDEVDDEIAQGMSDLLDTLNTIFTFPFGGENPVQDDEDKDEVSDTKGENTNDTKDDDSDGDKEGRDFGEPASLIDAFTSAFTDMSTKGVNSDSIKEHVDSFATIAKGVGKSIANAIAEPADSHKEDSHDIVEEVLTDPNATLSELVVIATLHPDKDVREIALDRVKNG